MSLTDTHCHIHSIDSDIEDNTFKLWHKNKDLSSQLVVSSALKADVTKMICVGTSLDDSNVAVNFVKDQANCWAAIGMHPHEAKHFKDNDIEKYRNLARNKKVVAIGECGLDYYYLHSTKKEQKQTLVKFIELAQELDLPLIFHVRDAFEDFWQILDKFPGVKGVVHSFSDSVANLEKSVERGLYIGVNGIATFNKNEELTKAYKAIPINNLLLETDAPYLTPVPYRGSINEPKRVRQVAEFLVILLKVDMYELESTTNANVKKLFRI